MIHRWLNQNCCWLANIDLAVDCQIMDELLLQIIHEAVIAGLESAILTLIDSTVPLVVAFATSRAFITIRLI